MKKNIISILIFFLLFEVIINITIFNNSVYAVEAKDLYNSFVVVKDITRDIQNFHPQNDSICGKEYSATKLYEKYLENNDAEYRDVFSGNHGIKRNFTVRYYWLHALNEMVIHIESDGIDYKKISQANSVENLKKVIDVTVTCSYNIGTFGEKDDDKISDEAGFFKDFKVTDSRSYNAFKTITGASSNDEHKELEKYHERVLKCIRELHAACDYRADSPVYGKEAGVNIKDSYEEKLTYDEQQIMAYRRIYGARYNLEGDERTNLIEKWNQVSGTTTEEEENVDTDNRSTVEEDIKNAQTGDEDKIDNDKNTIFKQPVGSGAASNGVKDALSDADSFVQSGNQGIVSTENLQSFSQNLYSILLAIGVVIAVIMGTVLGVKLMVAPIEERVEAKKLLVPYVVGCVIVFGAFGIWKLVVTIMQGL